MSSFNGPGSVTNGLVFAYDMDNRYKSWMNPPGYKNQFGYRVSGGYLASQVDSDANMDSSAGDAGWGHWGSTGIVGTYGANTDKNFIWDKSKTYSHYWECGSSSAVNYLFYRVLPFEGQVFGSVSAGWGGGNPNGNERCFKFIFKRSDSGPITAGIVGIVANSVTYYRPFGDGVNYGTRGGSPSSIVPWTSIKHLGDGWYECIANHLLQDGSNDLIGVYLTPGYRVYVGHCQMEEYGVASTQTFVGTRSSTNAILDMIGTNTITANSLTYNSDGSFTFNGSSNYLSLPSDVTFKSTGGHTVENWFKLDAVVAGNLYNFIGASVIDYHSWYWCVFQSKLAIWNRSPGAWYYGSTTIQPNTWYQAVMVTNDAGTGIQFYLNGVAEGGTHASYSFNSSYSGLKIGYLGRGDSANGRYLYGSMSVTKVYSRALTANEVRSNFQALRGRYGI